MSKKKKMVATPMPIAPPEKNYEAQARYIKDAFFEGWNNYATPANAYNTPGSAWEESRAKVIHDHILAIGSEP